MATPFVHAESRGPAASHDSTTLPVARDARPSVSIAESLVDMLVGAGITHAYGLIGGAIAPFARALESSPIQIVHCRHEAGAAFAATEAYFATGRPGLVFATTGPGVMNALTGLAAARWEGAKVLLVSAATPASNRGRWAFQETGVDRVSDSGTFPRGGLFDESLLVDDASSFPVVANRILRGLRRAGPYVAHVQLPASMQSARAPTMTPRAPEALGRATCDPTAVDVVVHLLEGSSFVVWAGFGARGAAPALRRFAERTGAPVMSSPRGKGIFPESHPQYLGVTGFGGHALVDEYMAAHRPDHVLVLGTRLGEMTSLWDTRMVARKRLLHVDIAPDVFGAAFPDAPTLALESDVALFLEGLMERGPSLRSTAPAPARTPFPVITQTKAEGPVRPQALMAAIQKHVVEAGDSIVLSEAGNAFAWATHWLRFDGCAAYRTSLGFGSMGHAATGVVGAALSSGRKALAILGDGAMLMNSEVSTAVQHRARAIWVVLNDSQYGMIRQGMESVGYEPFATAIPRTDFARIAEAMGARGLRVQRESELAGALSAAMREAGPVVVDVDVDPMELAPSRKRNASLLEQGVGGQR